MRPAADRTGREADPDEPVRDVTASIRRLLQAVLQSFFSCKLMETSELILSMPGHSMFLTGQKGSDRGSPRLKIGRPWESASSCVP
jgi:hypothetical protein